MKRALIAGGLILAVLAGSQGAALASWHPSGSGGAQSLASSLPTGNTPSGSVTGRNVTVSWSQSSILGNPVTNYSVKRYDASTGVGQTIGASCNGTVNGLTCTEASVPPGSWKYSVAPVMGAWVGAEGSRSSAVTVGSPSLTFTSPTTFSSVPTTLNGNIANYVTGETITFRLDNPSTGPTLSCTVTATPIPNSGASAISVTIPAGTSVGNHTVYAVGSSGASTASAGITVQDTVAPSVTSVIGSTAGGNPGFIKQNTTYYIYANVTDPAPSSGINTLTANVNNVTTGQTAVTMTSGSYTAGGTSYNYRSASLTANNPLTAGSKSYTVTAADVSGNSSGAISFSVTVDNTNPTVTASVIGKTAGGIPGFVKASGTYYIYANASDATSGISTVTANVAVAGNVITTGQTAVSLTSAGGPFTIGGVSYTYRSASVTADAGFTAGAKNYSVTATDGTANNSAATTFSVTGDITAPSGSNIQTTNGGGQSGFAAAGDLATYTYSEQVDPDTILSGWSGASTTVTFRLIDGGGASNDRFEVWNAANTTQLGLGSVTLGASDYISGGNAVFSSSTMAQAAGVITVTLGGTATGSGTIARGSAGAMQWTPSSQATDRAGNACLTTVVNESGGNDRDL